MVDALEVREMVPNLYILPGNSEDVVLKMQRIVETRPVVGIPKGVTVDFKRNIQDILKELEPKVIERQQRSNESLRFKSRVIDVVLGAYDKVLNEEEKAEWVGLVPFPELDHGSHSNDGYITEAIPLSVKSQLSDYDKSELQLLGVQLDFSGPYCLAQRLKSALGNIEKPNRVYTVEHGKKFRDRELSKYGKIVQSLSSEQGLTVYNENDYTNLIRKVILGQDTTKKTN